jgi:D-sedoheptulose 7-phosphate isomerase
LQPCGQRFSEAVRHRSGSPLDNFSELTARTNDEGWDTVFAAWLATSRLNGSDAILVFSVGAATRRVMPAPIS